MFSKDKYVNIPSTGIVVSNFCYDYITQVLFSVVYGFTAMAYWALTGIVSLEVTGIEKFVKGYGMQLLFMGIGGIAGPPICGKYKLISYELN